jgi:hypothetical protein
MMMCFESVYTRAKRECQYGSLKLWKRRVILQLDLKVSLDRERRNSIWAEGTIHSYRNNFTL